MNREEAISVLKVLASFQGVMEYLEQHSVSVQDACNMAISALEQTDIEQKAQEYEKAFMDGFESCSDLFTRNKEQQPCDDAISRSGAIKAIEERAKRIKNEDTLNGLAGAAAILFELPPVNPQYTGNEFFNFDAPMVKKSMEQDAERGDKNEM